MNVCKNDGIELKHYDGCYDGCLGYEAVYCPKCGYFADCTHEGQDDFYINL